MEILKVSSSEEGMKKLFKITSLIDLLINKITEYELIYKHIEIIKSGQALLVCEYIIWHN